jgi:hypothetical protein
LTLNDVESFLGKVSGTITCDYKLVGFSINEGRLFVQDNRRHPIFEELKLMGRNIFKDKTIEETNGSRWKKLQQRLWRKK